MVKLDVILHELETAEMKSFFYGKVIPIKEKVVSAKDVEAIKRFFRNELPVKNR